jgi:hypothetical protein
MFLSVVLHVALFLLADWLIGDNAQPSISSPLPVINVQSLRTENEIATTEKIEDRKAIKVADRQDKIADFKEMAIETNGSEHESHSRSAAAAVKRTRIAFAKCRSRCKQATGARSRTCQRP